MNRIAARVCLAFACVPHVLSAWALIDCGGRGFSGTDTTPLTLAGVLEVDDSFSADERAGIELGVAEWNMMARGAALRVVISPRARVLEGAAGALPPSDTLYLEHAIDREDGRAFCASRGLLLIPGAIATTVPLERGAFTCASSRLASEVLGGRVIQAWSIVVAHESGHAMGLGHDDAHAGDTVMTSELTRAVPVTCRDVRALHKECARP